MATVYVVEDNEMYRRFLASVLSEKGHSVTTMPDGTALYRELLRDDPNIVVLDIGLPDTDGFCIAEHLRSLPRTKAVGIIMVTARSEIDDRLAAIARGADVFLTKPIDGEELNAYICALERRIKRENGKEISTPWLLKLAAHRLITPGNNEIGLSYAETKFLHVLAQNEGMPVQRKELIALTFKEDPLQFDERRLEAFVSRLRRKIRRVSFTVQPIKTAHAIGYMFAAPIIAI